ncbi:Mrp/NBP35 family ATP-binding protein [Gammaproteobacteria bacterium]|nr:Mrp/NBP35 family ATP-binding protein [Gammaproteobacteria bacterium]MDA9010900.1 Mrp/NBP35 family ATP-binding protein [Gammaproteobacteria bacterium]MDA9045319.1 Mrp/NBP35 family ATP-binding protein [Gammaproteobacteria bacterium]MDA9118338.1 Mrp/NBP35 family ATP-binding protein [Gammaproteobacteria bacterium]
MSIKKIIAVASAKGGVGKSTITAALASYLSKSMKIGILDADIYGPNQHILFNVTNSKPNITNIDGKKLFIPITVNNIKLNSMGFILDEDKAAVWRGPMLSGAIRQLMQSTLWGELDILFIDMPPGTGDAYLTVVSEIKPDHALLITTPSKLSIQDTLKSFSTFSKLNTNIIGFIVNNIFRQTEKIEYTEFLERSVDFIGGVNFEKDFHDFQFNTQSIEIEFIANYLIKKL